MAVSTATPRRGSSGLAWVGVNVARFIGTWAVVGGVFAAAIMVSEGDGLAAPTSLEAILSLPFVILAFAFMSIFTAAVGLVLFALFVAPGLALYLLAIWSGRRVVPPRGRRAAAMALSPLIPVLVLFGGDDATLEVAMLVGSVVYGSVLKLP